MDDAFQPLVKVEMPSSRIKPSPFIAREGWAGPRDVDVSRVSRDVSRSTAG